MKPVFSIMPERAPVENDPQRCFDARQRLAIFQNAKGRCDLCGVKIRGEWIAGHIILHAVGGRTVVSNGRVECPDCSKVTHKDDTDTAARCKRQALLKGQQARRAKNGPTMKSRGFDKTLRKKFDGSVVKR